MKMQCNLLNDDLVIMDYYNAVFEQQGNIII